MKTLDQGLASHLEFQATTLCSCWIIRRQDGLIQGFTDHDNDIAIEGVNCLATSGFQSTEAVTELGLSVDNQDVEGVLSSDAITEDDLRAGRYDNARIEIWFVNWQAPTERMKLREAILGEVNRDDAAFSVELRGLTSLLDQPTGRVFSRSCDAILGDKRCSVNLNSATFKTVTTVSDIIDRLTFTVTSVGSLPADWFACGQVTWLTGKNKGLSVEISGNCVSSGGQIRLWKSMPFPVSAGDSVALFAGCDKSFATCKSKFSNSINFRGFPHMPGTDFALSYAKEGKIHDGSPLVR